MGATFKPMLAHNKPYELSELTFPLYGSAKLDGIRATVVDGKLVTRSLKAIPNHWIRQTFLDSIYSGLDGELIVGSPTSPTAYRDSVSAVMCQTGQPDFVYYVFDDHTQPEAVFSERLWQLKTRVEALYMGTTVVVLEQRLLTSIDELNAFELECLTAGYEGVILRKPNSKYKYGRSTFSEGGAIKLKRYAQDEAEIIGFTECMENQNVAFTNELGNTTHTSHQENLVGKDMLGALLVRDIKTGVEFNIGTGFTAKDRKEIWDTLAIQVGRIVTYAHFPIGSYDKPRFPSFKGFRDPIDM